MRGRSHGDEVKGAVLAALLAGQSVSEIAEDYHIAAKTVRDWRKSAGIAPGSPGSPVVPPQKRDELGEIITDNLRAVFRALGAQIEHYGDKRWLNQQNAADSAVLTGVLYDKVFRILGALDTAAATDDESEPDTLIS